VFLSFVALVIPQSSIIDSLLLEVAASKKAWRSENRKPCKKIVKVIRCSCERCCARATLVKSRFEEVQGIDFS
jgi:hypothetical protein